MTVLCFQHALRLAEVLFGSPKFLPQMIVCILGGYETNKGFVYIIVGVKETPDISGMPARCVG